MVPSRLDFRKFDLAIQNFQLLRSSTAELRRVLSGMRFAAAEVEQPNTDPGLPAPAATAVADEPRFVPALTSRERTILQLIAEGASNEDIAERLHFGHGTIKLYVRGILGKFGTSNRTVAAVDAVRLGII
jgi:DNA-binding NarL/FixJ family response regulator